MKLESILLLEFEDGLDHVTVLQIFLSPPSSDCWCHCCAAADDAIRINISSH